MCLGSGRSSGPAIKSPTSPEVRKAPPDESTSKPQEDFNVGKTLVGQGTPASRKTWDDVDNTNQAKQGGRTIQGSNITI